MRKVPSLEIVPASELDVPVILELIREFAEYEKLTHFVTATSERLRETLFGKNPAAEVILAHWNQECAGYAVFFGTYSTFLAEPGLYLEDLYVKQHLRGNGIGLAIFRYVAKASLQRGCKRLEWGVLDWNEPAIEFYRNLGASVIDQWTKYRLSEDALRRIASRP